MSNRSPPNHPLLVLLVWYVVLVGVGCFWAWRSADGLADKLSWPYWLAYLLIVLAFAVGLPVLIIGYAIAKLYWRRRRLRSEKYVFALARKSAGLEGSTARFGPVGAWMSDPEYQLPILKEQLALACERFEQVLAVKPAAAMPLRAVCLGLKDEFVSFVKQLDLLAGSLDSFYLTFTPRHLVTCLDQESERPVLLERAVRETFSFYLIDEYKGFMPANWLNSGLGHVIAAYCETDVLGRVNRKMLAALERGSVLDVQGLFRITPCKSLRLVNQWRDYKHFVEFSQFAYQSLSVLHYLCGDTAPEERRQKFRAFFQELHRKDNYERVFTRHFGYGFARLMQAWQDWVRALGHGTHEPPPPRIRKALLRRVIPFLRDPNVSVAEATLAIRDMGMSGYTLGADTLIGMLETEENKELRREVIWALESIAGYAHGDDVRAWRTWWESLPVDVVAVDVGQRM